MAARALCSTLMSTERSSRKSPFYKQNRCRPGRQTWGRGSRAPSRCSSGSSLRRLGGTVVMRIFTVASAELISKPVSLVSMVRTGERTDFLTERLGKIPSAQELPQLCAWALLAHQELRTFAGVLRSQAFHYFVSQGCHSFHWGAAENQKRIQALPSHSGPGADSTHRWVRFSG